MNSEERIAQFLAGSCFAVVGASTNREKYGNKVFRCYKQNNREVYPVNPRAKEIEGDVAYPDLAALPRVPDGVSVIVPPKLGVAVVEDAHKLGIKNIWYQPGAESEEAIRLGEQYGINVIADGSCLLVVLGYHE